MFPEIPSYKITEQVKFEELIISQNCIAKYEFIKYVISNILKLL